MRKIVTLRFPSTGNLCNFWRDVSRAPNRVSLAEKLLTQDLTDEEIQLALKRYSAIMTNQEEVVKQ